MPVSPFEICGNDPPLGPVVISVPHAGRAYPAAMPQLRVPVQHLQLLEDRHADLLVMRAVRAGATALIATTPRLIIDLNRSEDDLDPAMVGGTWQSSRPVSARARGGLGLIPRTLTAVGEIWRGRLPLDDVNRRIGAHHSPYHQALSRLLTGARARFGAALLIDLHSMPPLAGADMPEIVIGDRFGTSAAPQLTACAEAVMAGAGFRTAVNTPYAGGFILTRHGAPAAGVHALQVEVDRSLYLDVRLDAPGAGLTRLQAVIATLVAALTTELIPDCAIAAE